MPGAALPRRLGCLHLMEQGPTRSHTAEELIGKHAHSQQPARRFTSARATGRRRLLLGSGQGLCPAQHCPQAGSTQARAGQAEPMWEWGSHGPRWDLQGPPGLEPSALGKGPGHCCGKGGLASQSFLEGLTGWACGDSVGGTKLLFSPECQVSWLQMRAVSSMTDLFLKCQQVTNTEPGDCHPTALPRGAREHAASSTHGRRQVHAQPLVKGEERSQPRATQTSPAGEEGSARPGHLGPPHTDRPGPHCPGTRGTQNSASGLTLHHGPWAQGAGGSDKSPRERRSPRLHRIPMHWLTPG